MLGRNNEIPLTIRLFQHFEVLYGGVPLPGLHLREGERLLAFLLIRAPEPVATQEIARRFWPAEAQFDSNGGIGHFPSVRQALSALRNALGNAAECLTRPQRGLIQLDTSRMEVDLLDFNRLAQIAISSDGGQAARQAVNLYRGPLLADWTEPWVIEARRHRQKRYELLLRQLALYAREQGQTAEEEQWLRLLLLSQPGDEETARGLLRLLSTWGRHSEALAGWEILKEALGEEKRAPSQETLHIIEELRHLREFGERPASPPHSSEPPLTESVVGDKVDFEPTGGAVPIQSRFYIERGEDALFHAALRRGDSVVLVKGARQVGKTSLLARGLQQARETGKKVVLTDFQKFNAAQLASPEAFYTALASLIARKLGISFSASDMEDDDAGPNLRMEQFLLTRVLPSFDEPLIWAIDEADRLFTCSFGSEVFGLFRSWHNERALDPSSEFSRLTLAIGYATEAQLFITDLNQSPFNVGTRVGLSDFTQVEIAELNIRYGAGALSPTELSDLSALVGGQPYLLRCGLNEVAQGMPLARLLATADRDEGVFGQHLRHLWATLERSPALLPVLRALTQEQKRPTASEFYRLRAAGILAGSPPEEAAYRCRLYACFFARQFTAAQEASLAPASG